LLIGSNAFQPNVLPRVMAGLVPAIHVFGLSCIIRCAITHELTKQMELPSSLKKWNQIKSETNMAAPSPIPIRKARMFLLPEWYLPKSTINASDGDLEGASSSCERWGMGFAGLVVIAVIAELVIAWIEPPYLLFLTYSGVADALIAFGIVGEVLLGTIWNNRIQTELRRRSNEQLASASQSAAEANERAATALKGAVAHELQLREMSRPRAFDVNKFKENLALEPRPGARAEVLYVRDCPDCWWLATLIWAGLKGAEWEIIKHGPIPEPTADKAHLPTAFSVKGMPHGITIVSKVSTFFPAIPVFSPALQGKDSPSGVLHFAIQMATGHVLDGVFAQTDESMPDDTVRVVIAPRP